MPVDKTTQQADQEALTAAIEKVGGVNKFWDGWQVNDLCTNKKFKNEYYNQYRIETKKDIEWVKSHDKGDKFTPYAGTWAEGRLIEAMGDSFLRLERYSDGWLCLMDMGECNNQGFKGDTALQALIAGRVAMLEGE